LRSSTLHRNTDEQQMPRSPRRKVSVPMVVSRFSCRRPHFSRLLCTGCHSHLTLQQPAESEPKRLLGTCVGCGRWYLLDCPAESGGSLMALLPDTKELHDAYGRRSSVA